MNQKIPDYKIQLFGENNKCNLPANVDRATFAITTVEYDSTTRFAEEAIAN